MLIIPITIGSSINTNLPLQLRLNMAALGYFWLLKYDPLAGLRHNNRFNSMTTNDQYDKALAGAKDIFIKKTKDYGTSWRVLRTISVVDQIFIKALRIKTI